MECQCGCGESVPVGSFQPGHELISPTALTKLREEIESLRQLVEACQSKTESKDEAASCEREIDDLFGRITSDQSEYDKQLLTLSAAFLGVGLAFIKDVAPLNTAICLDVLYTAFGLLVFCIFAVLFSYQFSIAGQFKAKKYWEAQMHGNNDVKFPYRTASIVRCINIGTGVLFAVGVALLALFVILNMNKGAQMQRNHTTQAILLSGDKFEKGQPIKTPPPQSPQNSPSPSQSPNPPANAPAKKP